MIFLSSFVCYFLRFIGGFFWVVADFVSFRFDRAFEMEVLSLFESST